MEDSKTSGAAGAASTTEPWGCEMCNARILALADAENEVARLRGLFGTHKEGCILCGHSDADHYPDAENFYCSVKDCLCDESDVRLAWRLRAVAAERKLAALARLQR